MLRTLLFLFLASPLLAQDLGDDSAPPPALDIVYIGDSITAGAKVSDPATQAPPVPCSKKIESEMNGAKVYFSNQGHSGHTTVDFLPSSHDDFSKAEDAARKLKQEHPGKLIFSIMLGTNDSAVQGPRGAPVSPDQYQKNMTAIIDQLLNDFPNAQVFIQRPTWYSPNTHNSSTYEQEGLERLNTYFPVIQSIVDAEATVHAGCVHVGDTAAYDYFKSNYKNELVPENGVKGTFYLHPNVVGSESLGKFWAKAILAGLFPNSSQ
jgi:lysophospholipase L1-like esterase